MAGDDRHKTVRYLRNVKITLCLDGCIRVRIQSPLVHVPGDAHDFSRHSEDVEVDPLTDGIVIAEGELGKAIVNDGNERRMFVILQAEKAAAFKGNAQCLQIVWLNQVE